MPLFFIPNFMLRNNVIDPMLRATEGTILSCQIAHKIKWAINLGGGYHHASKQGGQGFCVFPDITLAVHYLRTRLGYENKKIMIIDLDAHQGNGYQRDLIEDELTFIVDCYNVNIYPKDKQAEKTIKLKISVTSSTQDQQYLNYLNLIQNVIEKQQPEFIIYNAGTDIIYGDKLGNMSITSDAMILRDQIIFQMALKRKDGKSIPITMLLSGGYQKQNSYFIAKSIKNLYQKFNNISHQLKQIKN